ncbi:MAG TPA: hypothetical protein VHV82_18545 [Sporichthyaceae bacterium]|nr:hypothetical protein [Sporichthyaceae bacterium]
MPSIKRTAAAVFAAAAIAGFGASPASAVGVQSAPMAAPALAPTCGGGCGHHHHHHHHCWESWRCDAYGGYDPYWGGGDCGCGDGYDPYWGYAYDAGWWGGYGGLGEFGGFGGHHGWGW